MAAAATASKTFSESFQDGTPVCGACGNTATRLSRCSGCLKLWFCDGACQKAYWPRHKSACRHVKKAGGAGTAAALMVSAESGDRALVTSLVMKHSVDVNATREDDGATALLLAVKGGHLDTVRELLRLQADAKLCAAVAANKAWKWPATRCRGGTKPQACRNRADVKDCPFCPPTELRAATRVNPMMVALMGKHPSASQDRGDEMIRLLWFGGGLKTAPVLDHLNDAIQGWAFLFLLDDEADVMQRMGTCEEGSEEERELLQFIDERASEILGYDFGRRLQFSPARTVEEEDADMSRQEESIMRMVRERHPGWGGWAAEDGEVTALTAAFFFRLATAPEDVLNVQRSTGAKGAGSAILVAMENVANFMVADFEGNATPLRKVRKRAEACLVSLLVLQGEEHLSSRSADVKMTEIKRSLHLEGCSTASEVQAKMKQKLLELEHCTLGLPVPATPRG